jgi:DNA-binding IclR family transcriptional regulator
MAIQQRQQSSQQGIKSIEIGAKVLLALGDGAGPQSLSQVARGSALHPAKAHRYLASLIRTGLAMQDPSTGLYDLGPSTRDLGIEALRRVSSVSVANNFAAALRNETGHTIVVCAWSDIGPVLVGWENGANTLPIVVRVGSALPILDSAIGHVFLAHLPWGTIRDALRIQQQQGTTRKVPAKVARAMAEELRSEEFTHTRNQMILGLAGVGAPIFGPDGALELAMGMLFPAQSTTSAEAGRLGGVLRRTADRASSELGFTPGTPQD